ncbi:MAG TPA: glycosyltransferase family 4 protein [Cyclobacteriaceae bacterium]|nr:glycosyltransferase family 4 protein [Cyclobacteriaceae bacterium]
MATNKPRILILENSTVVTGAMKAIVNVTALMRTSFSFLFIIPQGSTTRSSYPASEVFELNMIEISKRIASLILYVPQLISNALYLRRFVRQYDIDLIHVNDLYNLIPSLARIFGCRVPYICHVRFMPERFPKVLFNFWLRLHLRHASKIIVVSEALRKKLPNHDKIIVIYDGHSFDKIQSSTGSNGSTFLYLSNFIPGKGQDHALHAFTNICNELPGWKLRFVGGDMGLEKNKQFLQSLKDLAEASGISDRIEWHGFTADVASQYRSADIILNFSESESFSMSTLEALSCGRPLIVSDCGGPSEIVQHNMTGILVPNKDVKAMERAMVRLATDAQLRTTMGMSAEADMRKRFDLTQTAKKLDEVYRSCLPSI